MNRAEMELFIDALLSMRAKATDAQAWNVPFFFAAWKTDTEYKAGDRVRYGSELYKCEQAHTSQATWTPDTAHSLWTRVDDPAVEWPEWVQPMGSTDAYRFGAKVSHNEKHWISAIDYNTYEPGVYGWNEA